MINCQMIQVQVMKYQCSARINTDEIRESAIYIADTGIRESNIHVFLNCQ